MKLSDILKKQGLFSNDIKARLKNNQIILNSEVITSDIELLVEDNIINAGDFIFSLIKNPIFLLQLKVFGFENLFNSNIENELTKKLNQFIFIRISKKEFFLLKKIKNEH